MATGMEIDSNEPAEMQQLIGQVIQITRLALNEAGWADYRWYDCSNSPVHVERKTWHEVFDIDRVEDQLARHLKRQPHARLLVVLEGVGLSNMVGSTIFRPTTGHKRLFVPSRENMKPMQMVYSWLYQVEKYCEIYQTSCLTETAKALVAFYRSDLKPDKEHTVFRRHIKKVEFRANPQVTMLMSIADHIGEDRAVRLIKQFGTLLNVLQAEPKELMAVKGIGAKIVTDLLRKVGRPDV